WNFRLNKENCFCEAVVYIENIQKELKILLDTGCSLYDPANQKPVLITEAVFGPDIAESFDPMRIKYIPYSALGTKHGVLSGIKTDRLLITHNGKNYEFFGITMAFKDPSFSRFGGYNAIISPEILNF
ncbi:MAG: sigma-E processing peptidase SpoIIGA, partial [Firmicutes bacterium]|nr:sigma-E processing peptidase SpoIIGA [Bacillota bacterium]